MHSLFRSIGVVSLLMPVQYLIVFGSQIMLARILSPEVFGVFAISAVLSSLLVSAGNLSSDKYIINHKKKEIVYNAAVTTELVISSVVFIFAILLAPFIVGLLTIEINPTLVQVMIAGVFYNPFVRCRAIFEKDMMFYHAKIPLLIGGVVGAVIAIYMANHGWGVWSLVAFRLVPQIVEVIILNVISEYKIKLCYKKQIVASILRFCKPLLVTNFIVVLYGSVDYYMLGAMLDERSIGFYWLGYTLSQNFLRLKNIVNEVMHPYLVVKKSDKHALKTLKNTLHIFSFIYGSLIILFVTSGEQIISLLFGDEWIEASHVVSLFMVVAYIKGMSGLNDSMHLYKKNTSLFRVMALINVSFVACLGFVGVSYYGVVGMVCAIIVGSWVVWIVSNKKIVEYYHESLFRVVAIDIAMILGLILSYVMIMDLYEVNHLFLSFSIWFVFFVFVVFKFIINVKLNGWR